jgi:hypothetical protein
VATPTILSTILSRANKSARRLKILRIDTPGLDGSSLDIPKALRNPQHPTFSVAVLKVNFPACASPHGVELPNSQCEQPAL